MVQIAFLIFAGLLLFQGIKALTGKETGEKKTPKGVAIATVVFGGMLLIFSLFIPALLRLYMGP